MTIHPIRSADPDPADPGPDFDSGFDPGFDPGFEEAFDDPCDGARPSPVDLLLLVRSAAAADLADYAAALVPTIGEDHLDVAADVLLCSRLRILLRRLTCVAVIRARARGAAWDTIGASFGRTGADAAAVYGPVVARWEAGDRDPWNPDTPTGRRRGAEPIVIDAADAAAAAATLDQWCRGRIQYYPHDLRGYRRGRSAVWRPVTNGIPGLTARDG